MKSVTNLCNRIPNFDPDKITEFITNYNNASFPKNIEIIDKFIEYIGGFKESVLKHIYECFDSYNDSKPFNVEVRRRLQDYAQPD